MRAASNESYYGIDWKAFSLLIPVLDASQLARVQGIARDMLRATQLDLARYLDIIPPLVSRSSGLPKANLLEAFFARLVAGARSRSQPLTTEATRTVIALWPDLSSQDRQVASRLLAQEFERPEPLDPRLISSVAAKDPLLRDAIETAFLRALGRLDAYIDPTAVVIVLRALHSTVAPPQVLLSLIATPGINVDSASQLAIMLAQENGLPARAFLRERRPGRQDRAYGEASWWMNLEPDRWKLADWAAKNKLNANPPRRPAIP